MIVSKGRNMFCITLLICLMLNILIFSCLTWFQVMLILDRRLQPHVPCESASHLACTMLAVLNDGWRDQMPVSTTALQLINHSHGMYYKMSTSF